MVEGKCSLLFSHHVVYVIYVIYQLLIVGICSFLPYISNTNMNLYGLLLQKLQ